MEYLQWQIDGEFICNIARTWFWDENRPYEKSEELLLSALGTDEITLDEKKRIAQDIIEGRNKDDIHFRPTKEQKDAIWEAIVKHDVRVNNVDIIL